MTGIERLNACFKAFPEETKALLHHMIPCPPGMEGHVFHREMPDGSNTVSLIGLLNGTLFREGERLAYAVPGNQESRQKELEVIEFYDLVPAERFSTSDPTPMGPRLHALRHTNKERHTALLAVAQFAKDHGFTNADIAYWYPENTEEGGADVEERLMDYDPGEHVVQVGLFLNESITYTIHPSPDEDLDDTFERVSVSEGDAP